MISTYPNFTSLDSTVVNAMSDIISRFEPYSDFNIASLSCWNIDNSSSVSILEDNLIIRMSDYMTNEPIISVIGDNNIAQTLNILLSDTLEVKLVPEAVIEALVPRDIFILAEDRDNFDYIYETQRIADLSGGGFKNKRNKIHQLMHDIGVDIASYTTATIGRRDEVDIMRIFDEWALHKEGGSEDTTNERIALKRFLSISRPDNVILTFVLYQNKKVAFGLQEIVNNTYAMFHFGKSLLHIHKHLDNFLSVQATIALAERNIAFSNWEQDLGIEGLRQAKNSYQPYKFLKKYTVRKASPNKNRA